MEETKRRLNETLYKLHDEDDDIAAKVTPLVRELAQSRWKSNEDDWKQSVTFCRSHELFDWLYQDPFSRRAFEKPRGYAGDAELLDIIYNNDYEPFVPSVSEFGRRMFPFIINRETPSAVRERRDILARQIDTVCEEIEKPDILSIACGHLCEARRSPAFLAGETGRFVAFDQDAASLAVVERELSAFGVETVEASIKSLLKANHGLGKFDFIYAAGLYDYLPDGFAHLFTAKIFQMLKPGGRLLIANFVKGIEDAGYIEIFMDWFLIYRDEAEMKNLFREIQPREIASQNLFFSENKYIAYLEAKKIN